MWSMVTVKIWIFPPSINSFCGSTLNRRLAGLTWPFRNLKAFHWYFNSISVYITEPVNSDKPESDQHFNFPLICEDDQLQTADFALNISHTSLESDTFYSDLGKSDIGILTFMLFSYAQCSARLQVQLGFLPRIKIKWRTGGKIPTCVVCPCHKIYHQITLIDEHKLTISFLRSCPELDKDIGAGFSDKSQIEFCNLDFPNIMEKNISRSAHSIKVCLIIFINPIISSRHHQIPI